MPDKRLEILAPAGDEEMLRAAVFSGADCVYLGVGSFNARQNAVGFTGQSLVDAVSFCHARGCGVYAALNTVVMPEEQEALQSAVADVLRAGCDAVIVQDLATANMVKRLAPGMPLHGSTQMSVHSLAGVQTLAALGFSRVILARELSLPEIEAIALHSPIELEIFVHGALCVCVSGQCYMSAFLGGRSANRGMCAAPCRLPFSARAVKAKAEEDYHLSLKDLSVLDALPRLAQIGVCSAKIEGRLRGPEYCAVVVDSARKAVNNQEYDKELLQKVFSRNGFTSGWFDGDIGPHMFGTRAPQEAAQAKAALATARQLYRREAQRVPLQMQLVLQQSGGELQVSDGSHTLTAKLPGPLEKAQTPAKEALEAALQKTGGTPFYLQTLSIQGQQYHLPPSVLKEARRQLLQQLLQLRQTPKSIAPRQNAPHIALPVVAFGVPAYPAPKETAPLLRARFASVSQMPHHIKECSEFVLPLLEAEKVPEPLRGQTWLEIPRILFGSMEQTAAKAISKAAQMGFKGFEAGNLGHFTLCKGLPVGGGFGLNCTNAVAAGLLQGMGCSYVTLSPELTLRQMRSIVQETNGLATNALCYGHLPLMVTRACPLHNTTNCQNCKSNGKLTDRKGQQFAVSCRHGVRTIYNPVPLWMADKLAAWPTPYATLYFTAETPAQAQQVLQAFAKREAAQGTFTRGLYEKGLAK